MADAETCRESALDTLLNPRHIFKCQPSARSPQLCRLGLATTFVPLPINVADAETWKGVALRYWQLDM